MSLPESAAVGWRDAIHELATFDRPSASAGEHCAADWIAARLNELGCCAVVEQEHAHGGYWWPIGLLNVFAAGAGLLAMRRRGRAEGTMATLAAGLSASVLWDDLGHGRRWFRRRLLPRRLTWNVVAEAGERSAPRTVMLVAHHDAAHSGLVFHPALGRLPTRLTPRLHERSGQSLPILYAVRLGPVMICAGAALGLRRLVRAGLSLAAGATSRWPTLASGRWFRAPMTTSPRSAC